ncbi:MAG: hypothetical protein MZV70_51555 [Desulfobacterales bacterium]|nr:hypothetical protein [Desulfobacterales bacterium]
MTKEEIFMNYEVLKEKYGAEVDKFPLGAIGIFNATDKIRVGLQQLMAGTRNWAVKHISRQDLFVADRGVRQGYRASLCDGGLSGRGPGDHRRLKP